MLCFHLDDNFVEQYRTKVPPFGFNGLGELVYRRTYSRIQPDGTNEDWYQTVRRTVEGTYSIQKEHIQSFHLGWNEEQGQKSAQEMYDLIYNMKFLPPGRGLWAMGTSIVHEKKLAAALNNCAFVSTENLDKNPSKPFEFLMDASMLGVGVGFDTKGANKVTIIGPSEEKEQYVVSDDREGWVKSTVRILDAYLGKDGIQQPDVEFDYSKIRPKGLPLKTFGGVSSGPDPLIELHNYIRDELNAMIGKKITARIIVDIFNFIGKCVVSGNVRRTAEIAFGEPDDSSFLDLKNYEKNPDRAAYGWTSNNSVFAKIGMDYSEISKHIEMNGEPGLCWLENMQKYGRMCDKPDNKDYRVRGGNPCLEQSLESYELCCLVETFPTRHSSKEEYLRTLKFAYLYAKTVTLRMTHWPETNRVMLRNRRIGCSVSGIAQFLSKYNIDELRDWLDSGYKEIQKWDGVYSEWFCIPKSIKTTSIKPSGTVSLLAGATPGMHFPESRFYIRRVRIAAGSPLLEPLEKAGYKVEADVYSPNTTMVVEIPVDVGDNVRTLKEVSMYEQISLAAFVQRYWADNQVSCTVTFDPKTEGSQIPHALDYFQYKLKGISFLPKLDCGAYPQMPYEEITEEEYFKQKSKLTLVEFIERKPLVVPIVSKGNQSPITVSQTNDTKSMNFKINLENASSSEEETDDFNIFPNAVSFCDGDHCEA